MLTRFEVLDPELIHIIQPEDVPDSSWLIASQPSPNQQQFADQLLARHPFLLIPCAVTRHSFNLLVSCDWAADKFKLVSQERFGAGHAVAKKKRDIHRISEKPPKLLQVASPLLGRTAGGGVSSYQHGYCPG